ncbi:MAG TPA: transglycosylase SLT domain-containing protein [Anaeromyxobacteraceae bacterium]|nr:transglycosylase SLT domain-containing protein [Anaeromyxobacteraceae bacterium]
MVSRFSVAFAILAIIGVGYQLSHKPTELLAFVPSSPKAPPATWSAYGALFREHSTEAVSPELLAALVQVESAGDPLARTCWRWHWSWNPLDLYGPPSTAVGILQITDGNYDEARRLCDHLAVAREGPWRDPRACRFNYLYVRWIPSHAIEMTAAWLDRSVRETLGGRFARSTSAQRRRLAAVVHLCGRRRGVAFARRGFIALPGERCGDRQLAVYLKRISYFASEFARLAAIDGAGASPAGALEPRQGAM